MSIYNYYVTQIPIVSDNYNYEFNTIINNSTYILRLYFNRRVLKWMLDIKDENNNPIIMGLPLLAGAKITKRFVNEKLEDIKLLCVINKIDINQDPTEKDLGVNTFLYCFNEK